MSADRIEREIEIEAPVDVVWAVVTEPHHIASWFTDSATLDLGRAAKGGSTSRRDRRAVRRR